MKEAIVTTTIFVPTLLDVYAADAKEHGRDVLFVVVGDKKTPPETEAYCKELGARSGFQVEYFSPTRQEEYLARFPELRDHIQWNCIMRRNVGMLYAYEQRCDRIATIDDDNFLVSKDYLGTHGVGAELKMTEVTSSTSWINVCALLREKNNRTFYHRGFPLAMRLEETWQERSVTKAPVVSAGLWLGDPDVDALERLYHFTNPTDAIALSRNDRITPAKGTWTPFNSQNTALVRKVIPAYFLSPKVGRYDDIWASYILKHIADHFDDAIVFGEPIVKQERNPHNYWRDLDMERYGHALTLDFVESLASITLSGTDYTSCYAEITDALPNKLLEKEALRDDERLFLQGYFDGMRIWRNVFATIA